MRYKNAVVDATHRRNVCDVSCHVHVTKWISVQLGTALQNVNGSNCLHCVSLIRCLFWQVTNYDGTIHFTAVKTANLSDAESRTLHLMSTAKVKLSLYLTKHYAIKLYGGVEVQLHTVKKSMPSRESNPGRPAHSLVTILTDLPRLLFTDRLLLFYILDVWP
jgi:hypothetical protein